MLERDTDLSKWTPLRANDIMALVKLDLVLPVEGMFLQTTQGFGMGKSTSSPLSDIFMEDFEQAALANYPTGDSAISPSDVILFWLRKADDTLVAVHKDHIHPLHHYLNSIHPDIKWTIETEQNGRIAMLDVLIIHNPDASLSFDVYRKPTHTNQYIPFNSHQPLSHKLSTWTAMDLLLECACTLRFLCLMRNFTLDFIYQEGRSGQAIRCLYRCWYYVLSWICRLRCVSPNCD